jgi:hypothetical protein
MTGLRCGVWVRVWVWVWSGSLGGLGYCTHTGHRPHPHSHPYRLAQFFLIPEIPLTSWKDFYPDSIENSYGLVELRVLIINIVFFEKPSWLKIIIGLYFPKFWKWDFGCGNYFHLIPMQPPTLALIATLTSSHPHSHPFTWSRRANQRFSVTSLFGFIFGFLLLPCQKRLREYLTNHKQNENK